MDTANNKRKTLSLFYLACIASLLLLSATSCFNKSPTTSSPLQNSQTSSDDVEILMPSIAEIIMKNDSIKTGFLIALHQDRRIASFDFNGEKFEISVDDIQVIKFSTQNNAKSQGNITLRGSENWRVDQMSSFRITDIEQGRVVIDNSFLTRSGNSSSVSQSISYLVESIEFDNNSDAIILVVRTES
ncbi:MAG: hypothetical protein AAFW75_03655 [Cyanobacteria bacterium J06636_16]